MKKIIIMVFFLPIAVFTQNSKIDVSGTSELYLFENNTLCADEIIVQQNASFIAEFYGDVFEGDCVTSQTPTGTGSITLPIEITNIESLPTEFIINSAYPNPFNPTTTIHYGIPDTRDVSIVIYDIKGRMIAKLFNAKQDQGWYELIWDGSLNDGSIAPAGLYIYKIQAANEVKTSKISLIK